MRLRFSLRTLIIVTALAAMVCFGWVAWPSYVATRFTTAFNRGDAAAYVQVVDAIVQSDDTSGRSSLDEASVEEKSKLLPVILGGETLVAVLLPRSSDDLLQAHRRLNLRASHQPSPLELTRTNSLR